MSKNKGIADLLKKNPGKVVVLVKTAIFGYKSVPQCARLMHAFSNLECYENEVAPF